MIFLIGLVFLVGLVAWFYHATQPPPATPASTAGSNTSASPWSGTARIGVAYIANGNLFYQEEGKALQQLHSPYIQEIENRLARSNERNAWKKDTSFAVSASRQMRQFGSDGAGIRFSSALFDEGKLYYFLSDDNIGGLFSFDLASGVELRIVHRANLALSDLQLDPVSRKLVCTSHSKDIISNIATLDTEGNQFRELTGGDTADSSPAWIDADNIVYQSAGLARSREGHIVALGHSTIQKLNLKAGSITAVLDDPQLDYLQPRVSAGGELLFIRRPYDVPNYSASNILTDTLLFPFRLLRAVFHYLNFFSVMYSRKPLTGAGGPDQQADLKEIIPKGRRIDTEKALPSEAMVAGVPSLVPASWQLVRRSQHGGEQVLATNVAAFDIGADGRIVYSNGRALFLLEADGKPSLVLKTDLIAEVVAR